MSQRQDSLYDQLVTVRELATKAGCYDVADFLRNHIETIQRPKKPLFKINFWARRPIAGSQMSEYFRNVMADDLDGAVKYLSNFFTDISVISYKELK